MKVRVTLIALVVCAMLVVGMLRPVPARALSTTDALLISGGVIVGYAALVVVGTLAANHNRPLGFVALPPHAPRRRGRGPRVRFAPRCAPRSGQLTLVCW